MSVRNLDEFAARFESSESQLLQAHLTEKQPLTYFFHDVRTKEGHLYFSNQARRYYRVSEAVHKELGVLIETKPYIGLVGWEFETSGPRLLMQALDARAQPEGKPLIQAIIQAAAGRPLVNLCVEITKVIGQQRGNIYMAEAADLLPSFLPDVEKLRAFQAANPPETYFTLCFPEIEVDALMADNPTLAKKLDLKRRRQEYQQKTLNQIPTNNRAPLL